MADGDEDVPAANGPADPPAIPSSGAQELERVGAQIVPQNLTAEHSQRLNEAIVKQAETASNQANDDRALRRGIAIGTSIAVGASLVAANVIFIVYGATNAWVIPGSTVSAWLGATVVQIIALAVIIVRSLFPPKD